MKVANHISKWRIASLNKVAYTMALNGHGTFWMSSFKFSDWIFRHLVLWISAVSLCFFITSSPVIPLPSASPFFNSSSVIFFSFCSSFFFPPLLVALPFWFFLVWAFSCGPLYLLLFMCLVGFSLIPIILQHYFCHSFLTVRMDLFFWH